LHKWLCPRALLPAAAGTKSRTDPGHSDWTSRVVEGPVGRPLRGSRARRTREACRQLAVAGDIAVSASL